MKKIKKFFLREEKGDNTDNIDNALIYNKLNQFFISFYVVNVVSVLWVLNVCCQCYQSCKKYAP